MTVTIAHGKTKDEAIAIVDGSVEELVAGIGGDSLEVDNLKKAWNGPRMDFSLIARLGFISIPLSGTALVDAENLNVDLVLPPTVNSFIGEDKVREGVIRKFNEMFAAHS